MGNIWVGIKALLLELGHEVVVPPPCTRRTLDLGTKYGPESACLPMKINIGNFIEALDQGADTILMAGGIGPCRFGLYAAVEREILRDLGYEFEMIVLEPPAAGLKRLYDNIARLKGDRGWWCLWQALGMAWRKIAACDRLEQVALHVRARAKDPLTVDRKLQMLIRNLDGTRTRKAVSAIEKGGIRELNSLVVSGKPVVNVGIVGEIYTVLEPFVNMRIEEKLGAMGVQVTRQMWVSKWIVDHVVLSALKKSRRTRLEEDAHPYLEHFVGGHGLESVSHTVDFARRDLDGVIHILPFTCMPEVVAQSVLPRVSEEHGIPVLTLIIDEHTGEAGLITRLEAFVDMIKRRKVLEGKKDRPRGVTECSESASIPGC